MIAIKLAKKFTEADYVFSDDITGVHVINHGATINTRGGQCYGTDAKGLKGALEIVAATEGAKTLKNIPVIIDSIPTRYDDLVGKSRVRTNALQLLNA